MVDVRPFRALRADPERAHALVAPPYDVMNADEARGLVADGRNGFLHVTRPEVDLPPDEATPQRMHAAAAVALRDLVADGTLVREPRPVLYVLRQAMGAIVQTGIVASASVDDYDAGRIRIHEYTRPDKELDRTDHVDHVEAHDEPVFLTYPAHDGLAVLMDDVMADDPLIDVIAGTGVRHELWPVHDVARQEAVVAAFAAMPLVYVADGHHRSAAASRVRARRREDGRASDAPSGLDGVLAVLVPTDRVHVMAYHRVVSDLGPLTTADLLHRLDAVAEVQAVDHAVEAEAPHTFGLHVDGRWYRCRFRDVPGEHAEPVERLDVSLLQDRVLAPILGIIDPRTDARLHFVGGIRGTAELERRVAAGDAAAFALHPTSIHDLIAVADQHEVMPPKSTWFEPKLPSGLVLHPIDDTR